MRTQGYCSNDPEPSHAQPGRTLPTLAICRRIACGEELKAEDLLPWQARPHGSASIIYNRMLPGPTLPAWLAHMEKTILVTGGSGFIGSNFILQWMQQEGTPVVNLDKLTYAGNPRNLLQVSSDPRYSFTQGDVCDRELLRKLFKLHQPRAIVHFAAESHVDRSIHGPDDFVRTNVYGTFCLLEEARAYCEGLGEQDRSSFRFLHVSTDEVYGSLGPNDPPFCETTPYAPNSPYSASKAGSDHLVRAYHHTYGLPTLTTNCSNNYGPYQFPEKLIPLVLLNARAGKPLPVYGDGQNVRDWVFVADHCDAVRTVLAKGQSGRNIQHRRGEREKKHRGRGNHLRDSGPVVSRRSHRAPSKADHLCERPSRPRPSLCHRRAQDRARIGMEAAREFRDRHAQDHRLVFAK